MACELDFPFLIGHLLHFPSQSPTAGPEGECIGSLHQNDRTVFAQDGRRAVNR